MGKDKEPIYNLQTIEIIREYWLERWIKPRKKYLLEKLFSKQKVNKETMGNIKETVQNFVYR